MALAGDIILASDQAKFVSAYTAPGLSPGGSSTYCVAKHAALLPVKELVLMNRVPNAEETHALGYGDSLCQPMT